MLGFVPHPNLRAALELVADKAFRKIYDDLGDSESYIDPYIGDANTQSASKK